MISYSLYDLLLQKTSYIMVDVTIEHVNGKKSINVILGLTHLKNAGARWVRY